MTSAWPTRISSSGSMPRPPRIGERMATARTAAAARYSPALTTQAMRARDAIVEQEVAGLGGEGVAIPCAELPTCSLLGR